MRDPVELIEFSKTAFCDQISVCFTYLAGRMGINARVVVLNGHVVAEAWHSGAWHLYDPDYALPADAVVLPSVAQLAADLPQVASLYSDNRYDHDVDDIVRIFGDPFTYAYPPGREVKLQHLLRQASGVIPAVAIAAALASMMPKH